MEVDHLLASVAATRERCEEHERQIERSRLGAKAADIDVLANEVRPLLEGAKAKLEAGGVGLALQCGFGPGTRNEPWLEIVCRPAGKWTSRVAGARSEVVTIRCRSGAITVGAAPAHNKLEVPVEPAESDQPITAAVAAQLALDRAVSTLNADADAKAAPSSSRSVGGYSNQAMPLT